MIELANWRMSGPRLLIGGGYSVIVLAAGALLGQLFCQCVPVANDVVVVSGPVEVHGLIALGGTIMFGAGVLVTWRSLGGVSPFSH